ncbi:N-acetylmuramoyl-L-alanine amidase [Hyphococcus flavus]|uniref:N-acetylmuramoyl-L-alanine amidase n=1 Tax=Hyphococcus flavus TaxID=1866326 RepID=A0AAE9ZIE3_9PROT|nr:N-acetylmuramoyl-L-alanine amidase [Hyphococcus flavus]WDI30870.1 N-acetylmuramoyl-L-alanine amidase [Hyphococcus flavus]
MSELCSRTVRCAVTIVAVVSACLGLAHAAPDLMEVRFGPAKDATRIVFDLNGAPEYAVSGDQSGAGRLYVDFAGLTLKPADKTYKSGKGHIARYGFADRGRDGVRAVLEFEKTAKIKEVFLLEPKGDITKHRLVVDLVTADKSAFMASLPDSYGDLTLVIEQATAESEDRAVVASTPQQTVIPPTPTRKATVDVAKTPANVKRVVVVDAGHGGRDPGSQGQSGTLEKTVTLSAALELAEILKKTGRYEVVLTRESDKDSRMLRDQRDELARRESLAREAGAELFISLHADAISQNAVRGASVYTLSDEGTARSTRLAKSAGNYHVYDIDLEEYDSVVGGILLDKAQESTLTNSSKFAELLIENLTGKTPMLNRSHRKGDLRVLLAADVPAVLLELAFISNAKDEANLNSPVWRTRVMTAVAASIDRYFEDKEPRQHAAARAGGAR